MRLTVLLILSLALGAQASLAQRPLPLTVTDSSDGPIYSVAIWQSKIFVGGRFGHIDSLPAQSIAVKDSGIWKPLGSGVHGTVLSMCVDSNGGIYVGGKFDSVGGIAANNVAHWDGSQWHALGGGVNDTVYALMKDSDTLYCGGAFDSIENLRHVALGKWTSTGWSTTPLPIESGRIRGFARSGAAVAAVGWVKLYSDSIGVGLLRGSLPLVGFPEVYHTAELPAVVFYRYGVITSGPPERSHLPGRRFSDYYYSFLNSILVAGEASRLARSSSTRVGRIVQRYEHYRGRRCRDVRIRCCISLLSTHSDDDPNTGQPSVRRESSRGKSSL